MAMVIVAMIVFVLAILGLTRLRIAVPVPQIIMAHIANVCSMIYWF